MKNEITKVYFEDGKFLFDLFQKEIRIAKEHILSGNEYRHFNLRDDHLSFVVQHRSDGLWHFGAHATIIADTSEYYTYMEGIRDSILLNIDVDNNFNIHYISITRSDYYDNRQSNLNDDILKELYKEFNSIVPEYNSEDLNKAFNFAINQIRTTIPYIRE